MLELFTTGKVLDVALAALVLEAVGLLVWFLRSGGGLPPLDILGQLAAGACLLLALRVATGGEVNDQAMLLLTASLPAHLFDLIRRVLAHQRRRASPAPS